jgi:predicted membrane protein
MRGAIARFFWSEERREREAPRRQANGVKVPPAVFRIYFVGIVVAVGVGQIPEHHVLGELLVRVPAVIVLLVVIVGYAWARHRQGSAAAGGDQQAPVATANGGQQEE